MPATLYLALALLLIVVLRQFVPIVASAIGIAIALGIALWGAYTYGAGGGMAFLGRQISPAIFFGFVGVLSTFEILNLVLAIKRRKRRLVDSSPRSL